MALLFILFLNVAVALAGSHLVPETCLRGPVFWCKDVATAVECKRELYCWSLQSSSSLQLKVVEEQPQWETLSEEEEALAAGIKCFACIKIMQKLKELAGENPDEAAINNAISETCKILGSSLKWVCRTVLKKFRGKIKELLENHEDPKEMCVDLKMCRSESRALPGSASYPDA